MKSKTTKITIPHQGAPMVNGAAVSYKGANIVGIEIDMKSKYCSVLSSISGSDGGCGVVIAADENSLSLKKDTSINETTTVNFDNFKGWSVFAVWAGRYSINVCLVKI